MVAAVMEAGTTHETKGTYCPLWNWSCSKESSVYWLCIGKSNLFGLNLGIYNEKQNRNASDRLWNVSTSFNGRHTGTLCKYVPHDTKVMPHHPWHLAEVSNSLSMYQLVLFGCQAKLETDHHSAQSKMARLSSCDKWLGSEWHLEK